MTKLLIDTNIWIYLYAKHPSDKYKKSRTLIQNEFTNILLSTQILGELYHVLTKKKLRTPHEASAIILETIHHFHITEIDSSKVVQALSLHSKYGYSYWDSLILATALLNRCERIYSEDMQHGQIIEGQLQIINPFLVVMS